MRDKVAGNIKGMHAELDPAGLRRIEWLYVNGGRIDVARQPDAASSGVPVPASEDAEIKLPAYHVVAHATFTDYKIVTDGPGARSARPLTFFVPRGAEAAAVRRARTSARVVELPAGGAAAGALPAFGADETVVVLGLCGALRRLRAGDVAVYGRIADAAQASTSTPRWSTCSRRRCRAPSW